MPFLLAFHVLAAVAGPVLARRIGRNVLLVLATAPASAAVWALWNTPVVFSDHPPEYRLKWVPGLDLEILFRLDPLSWLMTLIVGGVGALVMVYASRYFSANASSLGRFAATFTGFAAAMLGLVTSDHLMMVYLFWELTTILSFLLIGHHHDRRVARAAARQAIQVTTSGSLAMFAGFVMLAHAPGGSYQISTLVEAVRIGLYHNNSPLVITGATLVIAGAAAKSALVPNHFWLPGAMAAPTPVSAYLHAAAMVKAGVYLVARLTPGFTFIPGWSPIIVILGLTTMLVGGYRALRQFDLKLILAYGTVSQLGLITAAVGWGTAATTAAGIAMLVAHALFKSALFMSVGLVEKTAGTRDLRELNNLKAYTPLLATAAGVCAVSMAGVPPLMGYLGKEALITSFLNGTGASWAATEGPESGALIALIAGSMLTVAYSWRYWWGAFANKRNVVEMTVEPAPFLSLVPIVLLAVGSFAALNPRWLGTLAEHITDKQMGAPHIALWSGVGPAVTTLIILGGGLIMMWKRPVVARVQRKLEPKHFQVTELYRWSLLELEMLASRITALVQRGSLPWDISTIMTVLVAVLAWALLNIETNEFRLRLWDSPIQLGIAVSITIAAIITLKARRRMKAVIALGVVGTGNALLYMSYGAPDLALTQLVIEVVSLVVFVLVLRSLPVYFSDRPLVATRWVRLTIAIAVGVAVSAAGIVANQARVAQPISHLIPAEAATFGAGENVVNVILVDVRAWDTVGELSVLLVTATGVASLVFLTGRTRSLERPTIEPGRWLSAVGLLASNQRSVMLEIGTRILFPTMIVASLWLTLIGHNHPGGGFAGGTLAGIALILRYMAGGRFELGEALPINPGRLLGFGLFTAAAGGALPLLFGNTVLQSTEINIALGDLGELHFTSALVVDIGVYILVLALVLDLMAALGAQIDRDRDEARRTADGRKQVKL